MTYKPATFLQEFDNLLEPADFLVVDGVKTALRFYKAQNAVGDNSKNKTLLLVHGMSGSYVGMIPLASQLIKSYNLILVDLPGHGDSQLISDFSSDQMSAWLDRLVDVLEQRQNKIVAILAHSFACQVVCSAQVSQRLPLVLLTPTPRATNFYRALSSVTWRGRFLFLPIYANRFLSNFRGLVMSSQKNRSTYQIVDWITMRTNFESAKISYQFWLAHTQLADYQLPDKPGDLILLGLKDQIPHKNIFETIRSLKSTKVVYFDGGHIAPIEQFDQVAKIVKNVLKES